MLRKLITAMATLMLLGSFVSAAPSKGQKPQGCVAYSGGYMYKVPCS